MLDVSISKPNRNGTRTGHLDAGSSAQTWILSVFLIYARQVIAVGAADVWPVDNVRAMAAEGLRLICIEIAHTAGLEYWVRWGGDIAPGVMSAKSRHRPNGGNSRMNLGVGGVEGRRRPTG